MMQEFNTSMVGKIVSFIPEKQIAVVSLYTSSFTATKERDYQPTESADLIDVPVHFPQCGKYAITMPITAGDTCLVFFTQRGIDHWLYEGREEYNTVGGRPEASYRKTFDRSNAIAIVGFNNLLDPIPDFNTSSLEIRNVSRDADNTTVQKIVLAENGNIDLHTTVGDEAASISMNATTGVVNINGVIFNPSGSVTMPSTLDVETVTASNEVSSPSILANGLELTGHTHPIAGSPANALVTGPNNPGGA